jgi:hypothetical protein
MDLKKTMNTDYLGSWDFKTGEKKVLTIKEIVQKSVFNPNKNKDELSVIMYFSNHPCGMFLNTTNKKMLIKLFGTSETDQYKSKNIQLITKMIRVRGEEMEAVRIDGALPIQPATPQATKKEILNELHKGWEPACEAIKNGSVTIDQISKKYELTADVVEKLKAYETV